MNLEPNELMTLVKGFMNKIDEQNKKIENLEKSIYEDFLGPAEQNFRDWDHSTRLGEFKEKYKDTFTEGLCNSCKKVEGDEEFDLPTKIFDDYEALEDKSVEEEEYVATVVANLKEQLDTLKETLNADTVEVTQDATGETEVVADGDKVAEATEITENEAEGEAEGEVQSSESESEVSEASEAEEAESESESDHDKELEEFIKELEETEVDHKNYY